MTRTCSDETLERPSASLKTHILAILELFLKAYSLPSRPLAKVSELLVLSRGRAILLQESKPLSYGGRDSIRDGGKFFNTPSDSCRHALPCLLAHCGECASRENKNS